MLSGGTGSDTYSFGPWANGTGNVEEIFDAGGPVDTFEFYFSEFQDSNFGSGAPISTFMEYESTDSFGVSQTVFLVADPVPSIEQIVSFPQ